MHTSVTFNLYCVLANDTWGKLEILLTFVLFARLPVNPQDVNEIIDNNNKNKHTFM